MTSSVSNVDQNLNGGQWRLLGAYSFSGRGNVTLVETVGGSAQGAVADAVRFLRVAGEYCGNGYCNATIVPQENCTSCAGDCVCADVTAPVISNIVNSSITNQSATISWQTDEDSNSSVLYGLTTGLGGFVGSGIFEMSHSISLGGLRNNTQYYYRVRSCDAAGNCVNSTIFNFRTVQDYIDNEAPVILLNGPANGGALDSSTVTLSYTVIDYSLIAQCNLYIGAESRIEDLIELNRENNFVLNLGNGEYSWNVSCNDSNGNLGESETRTFSVNYAAPSGSSSSSGSGGGSSGGGATIKPKPIVNNVSNETNIAEGTEKVKLEEKNVSVFDIITKDNAVIDLDSVLYEVEFEVVEAGVLLKAANGIFLIKKEDIIPVLIGGREIYVAAQRMDAEGAGIIIGLDRNLVMEKMGISGAAIVEEDKSPDKGTLYYLIIVVVLGGFIVLVGWYVWHLVKGGGKIEGEAIRRLAKGKITEEKTSPAFGR